MNTRQEQGFSLIEVLIAVALLGVAIVTIVGLIPTGYMNVVEAGHLSTMSHIAYRKIDDLKREASTNWDSATATGGDLESSSTGLDHNKTAPVVGESEYADYSIYWTVKDGPQMRKVDDPDTFETTDQIKYVTVTVGFKYLQADGSAWPSNTRDQIVRVFTTIVSSNR